MILNYIDIQFNYTDLTEGNENKAEKIIKASVGTDGWQQWGQPKEVLEKNVELLEELNQIISKYLK